MRLYTLTENALWRLLNQENMVNMQRLLREIDGSFRILYFTPSLPLSSAHTFSSTLSFLLICHPLLHRLSLSLQSHVLSRRSARRSLSLSHSKGRTLTDREAVIEENRSFISTANPKKNSEVVGGYFFDCFSLEFFVFPL